MKAFAMPAVLLLILMSGSAVASAGQKPGYWQYPAIPGYGRIHPRPKAAEQPSPHKTYKVAFDVTKAGQDTSQPNPGLNHVARAVNVFASAGVPLKHLHFVAVIHGPATPSVLKSTPYRKKFNKDNPNVKLIAALRKAGVKIEVCAQALADHQYQDGWINPDVTISLSGLSDLAVWGSRGYTIESL